MFKSAKPVWIAGRENEINSYAVLKCSVDIPENCILYISGFTSYRVFSGGKFIHYGPARTAGGYGRVDEIELSAYKGEIIITACGYRCFCLSTVNQPSFICAEIRDSQDRVIAATGICGFEGYAPSTHMQKVMRYSRQRHFSEIWDYRDSVRLFSESEKTELITVNTDLKFIPRSVSLPDMSELRLKTAACMGSFTVDGQKTIKNAPYGDSETQSPEGWGGWPYNEIPYKPFWDIQRCLMTPEKDNTDLPLVLHEGEYAILEMDTVKAGFIGSDFESIAGESDVIIGYNEYCDVHNYTIPRMTAVNVIEYLTAEGGHVKEYSAEPYTAKIILFLVKKGTVRLNSMSFKLFRKDISDIRKAEYKDDLLKVIDDASIRSFADNAVDIYMDCPSRERAGWLCDSYFTSQVEYELTGKTETEDVFLENFLINRYDSPQPYGRVLDPRMLPMCYPADLSGSLFIPQWAMWFVLEADMYVNQRGHKDDREKFRKKVTDLCDWFAEHENADGLLEKLPGWQFIEWSQANKWGQDINYATNFLYAEMLDSADRILAEDTRHEKAEKIRRTVIEKSFNGKLFVDNAVYGENGAVNTENISEVCQYYAIRFGHIDLEDSRYAYLKDCVFNVFHPGRPRELMPEVEPADALMGIYLRMEILNSLGDKAKELNVAEIRDYFGERASKTGTLWEYREAKGSLDHGFASFAGISLRKALNL